MTTYVNHGFRTNILTLFLFVVLVVISALHQTKAATIEWTINNGNFADGGVVTGSFNWDTDLKTLTSWNFSVSGGDTSDFPSPFTYSDTLANNIGQADRLFDGSRLLFFDSSPNVFGTTRELRFGLASLSQLDIASSMLPLFGINNTGPTGLIECYNCSPIRLGRDGAFLSASVVPVPAAVWLFGSALIGLVGFGKRSKAA